MSGWLYVGDDGLEWSAHHPVRSGEMPDARLIRPATNAELLAALKDAWKAHGETIQSEGSLRERLGGMRSTLDRLRAEVASPESLSTAQDEPSPSPPPLVTGVESSSVSQSAATRDHSLAATEAEPAAEAILTAWCDHVEPLLAGRHDHVRMTPDEALALIRGIRALLEVLPQARAARSELKDHVIAAYEQGALDVHGNWQEDADPDFKEAAYDYAASAL